MSAFSSLQTVQRHSNFPPRTGGKLEEIQSRRHGAAGGNQNCSIYSNDRSKESSMFNWGRSRLQLPSTSDWRFTVWKPFCFLVQSCLYQLHFLLKLGEKFLNPWKISENVPKSLFQPRHATVNNGTDVFIIACPLHFIWSSIMWKLVFCVIWHQPQFLSATQLSWI